MTQSISNPHFDIIIAGAGLAGLSLALELSKRPAFQNKKVLLLDRDAKQHNDRTWCCWASPDEDLPREAVSKTWQHFQFFGENFEKKLDAAPFQYLMTRSADFYQFVRKRIAHFPNFQFLVTEILQIDVANGEVCTAAGNFWGEWIFDSRPPALPLNWSGTTLLQHFKGWFIEVPQPIFDVETVTFMDFRVEQHGEARFVYVLPLTERRALVEFTVFSPALLEEKEYISVLQNYLHQFLQVEKYEILEEEFGVIPMTDFPFQTKIEGKVVPIGTAAGFVKGSSGYAYKRTLRKIRKLADDWEKTGVPHLEVTRSKWRFRSYDSIFLRVFRENSVPPRRIFTQLFSGQRAREVFQFLDEDTRWWQEPRTLLSAPFFPFLTAFFRGVGNLFRV